MKKADGNKMNKKGGERMSSIWACETRTERFPALDGSRRADVVIIGGGVAGLLLAHRLKRAGASCALIEAKEICSGTTGNTTAKITYQHGLIYGKILKKYGAERARLYYEAQASACLEYRKLCERIDCDYERRDSYVYSLDDRERIEEELAALERIGCSAELSMAEELPFAVAGAVKIGGQAQLHPLKLLYALAEELEIYENTKARSLAKGRVVTDRGEISCENIVVATHFPILNKHGGYFLKLYQHRSYVLALEGAQRISGMYVDGSGAGLSLRGFGDTLLLGGGSHRTGKRGGGWDELLELARLKYPEARVRARWAAQDCMSLDGLPYIGRYSRGSDGIFVATGFNKWGFSSSMVAADMLTDLILGARNPYEELFSPSRSILHPQLAVNAVETVTNLLTPFAPRCPHLGCALKYNKAEHSWDCPCHGSRFSEEGELLDNPATDDKRP